MLNNPFGKFAAGPEEEEKEEIAPVLFPPTPLKTFQEPVPTREEIVQNPTFQMLPKDRQEAFIKWADAKANRPSIVPASMAAYMPNAQVGAEPVPSVDDLYSNVDFLAMEDGDKRQFMARIQERLKMRLGVMGIGNADNALPPPGSPPPKEGEEPRKRTGIFGKSESAKELAKTGTAIGSDALQDILGIAGLGLSLAPAGKGSIPLPSFRPALFDKNNKSLHPNALAFDAFMQASGLNPDIKVDRKQAAEYLKTLHPEQVKQLLEQFKPSLPQKVGNLIKDLGFAYPFVPADVLGEDNLGDVVSKIMLRLQEKGDKAPVSEIEGMAKAVDDHHKMSTLPPEDASRQALEKHYAAWKYDDPVDPSVGFIHDDRYAGLENESLVEDPYGRKNVLFHGDKGEPAMAIPIEKMTSSVLGMFRAIEGLDNTEVSKDKPYEGSFREVMGIERPEGASDYQYDNLLFSLMAGLSTIMTTKYALAAMAAGPIVASAPVVTTGVICSIAAGELYQWVAGEIARRAVASTGHPYLAVGADMLVSMGARPLTELLGNVATHWATGEKIIPWESIGDVMTRLSKQAAGNGQLPPTEVMTKAAAQLEAMWPSKTSMHMGIPFKGSITPNGLRFQAGDKAKPWTKDISIKDHPALGEFLESATAKERASFLESITRTYADLLKSTKGIQGDVPFEKVLLDLEINKSISAASKKAKGERNLARAIIDQAKGPEPEWYNPKGQKIIVERPDTSTREIRVGKAKSNRVGVLEIVPSKKSDGKWLPAYAKIKTDKGSAIYLRGENEAIDAIFGMTRGKAYFHPLDEKSVEILRAAHKEMGPSAGFPKGLRADSSNVKIPGSEKTIPAITVNTGTEEIQLLAKDSPIVKEILERQRHGAITSPEDLKNLYQVARKTGARDFKRWKNVASTSGIVDDVPLRKVDTGLTYDEDLHAWIQTREVDEVFLGASKEKTAGSNWREDVGGSGRTPNDKIRSYFEFLEQKFSKDYPEINNAPSATSRLGEDYRVVFAKKAQVSDGLSPFERAAKQIQKKKTNSASKLVPKTPKSSETPAAPSGTTLRVASGSEAQGPKPPTSRQMPGEHPATKSKAPGGGEAPKWTASFAKDAVKKRLGEAIVEIQNPAREPYAKQFSNIVNEIRSNIARWSKMPIEDMFHSFTKYDYPNPASFTTIRDTIENGKSIALQGTARLEKSLRKMQKAFSIEDELLARAFRNDPKAFTELQQILPPEGIRAIRELNDLNKTYGKERVKLGLLDKDLYKAYGSSYQTRFFRRFEDPQGWAADPLLPQKAEAAFDEMISAGANPEKVAKWFESILQTNKPGHVAEMLSLRQSFKKDPLTPAVIEFLGEASDPIAIATNTLRRQIQDASLGKLFQQVSENPTLFSRVPRAGYRPLKEKVVPPWAMHDFVERSRWGQHLKDGFVQNDVADSLERSIMKPNEVQEIWNSIRGLWKQLMVPLNPPTVVMNIVDDSVRKSMGGMPIRAQVGAFRQYWPAFKDYVRTGHIADNWISQARKLGVLDGTYTQREIGSIDLFGQALEEGSKRTNNPILQKVRSLQYFIDNVGSNTETGRLGLGEAAKAFYQHWENFSRFTYWKYLVQNGRLSTTGEALQAVGAQSARDLTRPDRLAAFWKATQKRVPLSEQAAKEYMEMYCFSYNKLPPALLGLSRTTHPFIAFQYFALKSFGFTAKNHPMEAARMLSMMGALKVGYNMATGDNLSVERMFANWGNMLDGEDVGSMFSWLKPSGPLALPYELATGTSLHTGWDFRKRKDSLGAQMIDTGKHVYNSTVPSPLKTWGLNKMGDDPFGYFLSNILGVRVTPGSKK